MKCIIVTGGVLSGIGKGITGASIGALLKASGYKIFMQKFDGYLNVDAGTINPFKHGECFVTEDGAETDLDIGHYERYLDTDMSQMSIFTAGKLTQELMNKERKGDYLGSDVQIIPHFTNLIKEKVRLGYETSGADISIIEVGGTVGDMENEAIVEAMRQLRQDLGYNNVVYVHLTYIPYLMASKELKTKPTQNSVKDLRMRGIIPDFLVCRADYEIPSEILNKIAYMTGVASDHVIPAPTVDTIYRIPLDYHAHRVGQLVLQHLGLEQRSADLSKWQDLYSHITNSTTELRIAMVGKYVGLEDAYYSLNESLKVAGFYHNRKIKLVFIEAEELTKENVADRLSDIAGICVPGGFGTRGVEGMILAIEYARTNKVPYLGICLGSQLMAIEFARNVLGYADATSAEFDPEQKSTHHIVHIMADQKNISEKGGTMRLGTYDCVLKKGSKVYEIYTPSPSLPLPSSGGKGPQDLNQGKEPSTGTEVSRLGQRVAKPGEVSERHRHRYEFNNLYRPEFEANSFVISGTSPDGSLVEMVELADHPFMVATQAHPELKARPTRPHPLMMGFVEACQK